MKRKKDFRHIKPAVKVIARASVFWQPMEAAVLGLEMGTPTSDDWFD